MTNRSAMFALLTLMLVPNAARAQFGSIRVEPATVSVATQGPTTFILTFSGLGSYTPAEALFCGRLMGAVDIGSRCDPATIYGQARSAAGAKPFGGVFTDIVSVSAQVAQRAYEAALAGQPARFYYVRRFTTASAAGSRDQYVVVVCQLGNGGVNAPFALSNVRLHSDSDAPIAFVRPGELPPQLHAEIAFTGTGRLSGRWEIVSPGEELPSAYDLLTEASLPREERGLQRRYREIQRFNVLLLPDGRFTLPGPDPARLPTSVEGTYTILLRIEASDGAVAPFPMPTLQYVVAPAARNQRVVRLRLPDSGAVVSADSALSLSWLDEPAAVRYRVEIDRLDGKNLLSAIVAQGVGGYDVPPFVLAQAPDGKVQWRVVALDADGNEIGHSESRRVLRRP